MPPLAQPPHLSTHPTAKGFSWIPLAWMRWKRLQPEALFLALALTLGLAVLLVSPPFQDPDEGDHFWRAFQISEGTMVGQKLENHGGGQLPVPIIAVANTEGIAFHTEEKMTGELFLKKLQPPFLRWNDSVPRDFAAFPHTVVYAPVSYLPQAVAIESGKILGVGPLGLLYLARLAEFAVSVALGYAALRCLFFYRWTAFVLLLGPMSFYLMGSAAMDGVLITGTFLLIALLLRSPTGARSAATPREQAVVLGIAGLLGTAKFIYLPLTAMALLIGLSRIGSRRGRVAFGLVWAAFCVLPALVWNRIIPSLFTPGRTDIPIDPVAQLHYIVGAPFIFLALMAKTVQGQYNDTYHWMVGILGWGDTLLPHWFYGAYGWSVLACLVLESPKAEALRWPRRLIMLGAALGSAILIYVAQYMSWNSPGSRGLIEGIEGRYFLPLVPLVMLSFPALVRVRVPDSCIIVISSMVGIVSAAICLWAIVARYYLP